MTKLAFRPWGVRGSFPAPGESTRLYGGNTSCFSILCGDSLVVFDAGSGLAVLGQELVGDQNVKSVHILLSHAHIDHLMGLYPFLSGPGRTRPVHIYGGRALDSLDPLIAEPYWPCSLQKSGAALHPVTPGAPFRLVEGEKSVRLSAMAGTHPGGCLWYRLDYDGRSIVYFLDCEVESRKWPEMVRFARNASLIVWDASFQPGFEKPGWGHSTWIQGADLCREANGAHVVMAHYSWDMADSVLRQLQNAAAAENSFCVFAEEGKEILL